MELNALIARYRHILINLLPTGWIWQRQDSCDGFFDKLLHALAVEYARLHIFIITWMEAAIASFARPQNGWSCTDYERVLLREFGLKATVTDNEQRNFRVGNTKASGFLFDKRFQYLITITVEDINEITDDVRAYLLSYRQSHTNFWFRESIKWTLIADKKMLVAGFKASERVRDRDWHVFSLFADRSWKAKDVARDYPIPEKRDYTTIIRRYPNYAPY